MILPNIILIYELMWHDLLLVNFELLIDVNYASRLENAVLDLVADDSEGLQKQKAVYHWDKVL